MKKTLMIICCSMVVILTGCSGSSDKTVTTDKKFYKTFETGSKKVTDYFTNQATANKATAKAVIDQINGLGTITVNSANSITTVRAAYDALTEAQKALVTNYATLTTAEATLKTKQDEAAKEAEEKKEASNNTNTNTNSNTSTTTASKLACTAATANSYKGKSINSYMAATGKHVSGVEDCLAGDGLAYNFGSFTVYTNAGGIIVGVE